LDATIIRAGTAGLIEEEQLFGKNPGAHRAFIIMKKRGKHRYMQPPR
jgi:hypothetical protein